MKKTRNETPAAQRQEQRACCGQCANAFGYCCPGKDGAPISCRCPMVPEHLISCKERACANFSQRTEPIPAKVTERVSPNPFADKVPHKAVPLFRNGEKEPWKWVDAESIPPQGISWTGEPFN